MNISLSDDVIEWFKKEMQIDEGEHVRFFARYGGSSKVQEGFSLGVSKDEPVEPAAETEKSGIHFFIEEKDIWYFDGHDLNVSYSSKSDGPEYDYSKS
ncbi:HesB/YadR/YfhF family protein [Jeotgalibacillus sp. R-1-5s-1]|uniref:HesB/YadR/YfhF family protein n=1 Tax=Jeotgalibacillus sp. R-1-5s-1 TaxID=2555897 RepID=UPI00106BCFF6|nr:HesB/YadR/YfhF family protein [Jeotgalibacillus sp. R-1-5s-1]TFE03374.1 HesB/YadR/YfhF family protein [Jeotgalibacillus sp. R-1-5s-1]